MKAQIIASIAILTIAHAVHGQFLIQNMNVTQDNIISTTAAAGNVWQLSGTVQDLSQFSGTDNPFGFANWEGHSSVTVSGGVLTAVPNSSAAARILTATNAYPNFPEATYRYLELTISRELISGSGRIFYRKDGNSIATAGQNLGFSWSNTDVASNDMQTVILDMWELPAWTNNSLTGLGFELQEGVAASKVDTSNIIYSVRLSTGITAIPEPNAYAAVLALAAVFFIIFRRFNK